MLIDADDIKRVYSRKWSLGGNGYLRTRFKGLSIYLHHFLVGQPLKPMEIDHINRNPLDNRKENLRIVNHRDNARNRGLYANNTSGHAGVSWYKRRKKWRARGYFNEGLGHYKTKEQAIEARRIYEAK